MLWLAIGITLSLSFPIAEGSLWERKYVGLESYPGDKESSAVLIPVLTRKHSQSKHPTTLSADCWNNVCVHGVYKYVGHFLRTGSTHQNNKKSLEYCTVCVCFLFFVSHDLAF